MELKGVLPEDVEPDLVLPEDVEPEGVPPEDAPANDVLAGRFDAH